MYLKSIEVHGFKSFADKINFKFHNGITGIVGPNGSGKSNVADAVRWVLGEQRIRQLRGASMQDVIFSGTESRKPIGYAYVAITLDNSDHQLPIDYNEVKIARRIYRSGESEYLLNGSVCRLKDVNELFYDTGIGKEGYSIIGQGQIDKILSGKPEERRELFDEAAGIVTFKKRKVESQKKLEAGKQDLLRVQDILGELEKQVGPLEKQAETAKQYLKKRESLKFYDVNKFLLENQSIKQQLEEVTQNHKIATYDLTTSNNQHNRMKEEYEEVATQLETLELAIEEARGTLTNTSVLRGKLEGEINVLKEQMKSIGDSESNQKNRLQAISNHIIGKEEEKSAILIEKRIIDEELEQLWLEKEQAKEVLATLQNTIEVYNRVIEESNNKIIETVDQRGSIKARMASHTSKMEQVAIRNSELDAKLLTVKSSEQQQEEVIQTLEKEFEEVSNAIVSHKEGQEKMEERLLSLREELKSVDEQLQREKEQYHSKKSKLDTISNLNERYEGYGASVKRVMEQKNQNKGLVGVVADIIKVEKTYEIAIETALGGNIQNIVTEDEQTAKSMIGYLKKNKFGRATFLPLTSILKPKTLSATEVLEEKGVLGMADQLVTIDSKYKNVATAMLGRIVVVDHMEHALVIARKYRQTIRMVTLEGELLVPGGAISGGAFKNTSNLLGRKRELEELEKQVIESKKHMDQWNEQISVCKEERGKLRIALEEGKKEVQRQFIQQNTVRLNLNKERERKKEVEQGFQALEQERLEIGKKIEESTKEQETILEELEHSEALEAKLRIEIDEKTILLEGERRKESTQSTIVSEFDIRVETIAQKQGFYQENVNRIQGEIDELQNEKVETTETIGSSGESLELKKENMLQLERTILESSTMHSDTQILLEKNIAQKEEFSGKQKQFFEKREEISAQMVSLEKEVYRLQTQKEKLEDSMAGHIHYMWNEYEITLSDAATLRDETMLDLPFMKKEVATLKEEIKSLGNVNINAIEDYKEVQERYDFLRVQHDDLVESEKVLLQIIEKLDEEMKKQFNEKFQEIAIEFNKVFKELFGGGKGTLELMEEEDILEAGIKIIAQPPGKKLQNMMQLSGGEKALAAIALLFAIQNLKPSPFCLLDEIEAALDENNVDRFAKYLSKLTKKTQFIVITHRRGTMEKADRLYGITMQEKGVSALVSVDLIEKEIAQ
ncbi:MAG: chromosome segregation protein SMC [Eubacteriales bacterium]